MFRRLILGSALILLGLFSLVLVRALLPARLPPSPPLALPEEEELLEGVSTRLQRFLTFPTISPQDPRTFDPEPFRKLQSFLEEAFPRMHRHLVKEVVNGYSLLYTWKGKDETAPPLLLMGHFDVVPVPPETLKDWNYPPFSGTLAEGYVWGRGALDDKSSVLALCEAVEALLARGYKPERTILLAFGHDEEIGGEHGAKEIARILKERGIKPLLVLDEGMAILQGFFPGVTRPVALIGIAEKGYMSVELTVAVAGGHSSVPTPENAIAILSRAILRLTTHPFRSRITPPLETLLLTVAEEMNLKNRLVLKNLWLFDPLVRYRLSQIPALNAAMRTTLAPTIFEAGIKENLLPPLARAVVNIRILPGDDRKGIVKRMVKIIRDPRVHVRELPGIASDPSPEASWDTPAFQVLARAIQGMEPLALVAPGLVVGATDSRHFRELTPEIYRFSPHSLTPEDLRRIHGVNERISLSAYKKAIRFYMALMRADYSRATSSSSRP